MIEFVVHGGTLALAWFILVNLVMSAVLAAGAGWIIRRWTGTDSAAVWFAARVLPAATALLFVGVVFVPSYWKIRTARRRRGFRHHADGSGSWRRRAAHHRHRPRRERVARCRPAHARLDAVGPSDRNRRHRHPGF